MNKTVAYREAKEDREFQYSLDRSIESDKMPNERAAIYWDKYSNHSYANKYR